MKKQVQAQLDDYDSEDDEDYVPPEEKNGKEVETHQDIFDEDKLTGIEALKNKKRNREVDDLFDLMNAEDPIKKALEQRKRQNTGATIQQGAQSKSQQSKEVKKTPKNEEKAESEGSLDLNDLDDKADNKRKVSDTETFNAAMAAIKAIQDKKNGTKMTEKLKFAGQSYEIERAKTGQDVKKEQRIAKNKLGGAQDGLDALVQQIADTDKNVTSIEKSKLDWDKYTKEQKLEGEFEKNRKDGYLAKKRFIEDVSELEYQQKKAGQKASRKALQPNAPN